MENKKVVWDGRIEHIFKIIVEITFITWYNQSMSVLKTIETPMF